MNKTKLLNTVLFMLIVFCFPIAAETVFEDELLTTADDDTIVFQNYSGPHKKIDTVEQIIGIGRLLGRDVDRDAEEFSYFEKYRIIHAVDYTLDAGLDADILILSQDAAVDHITNLRRIISGYLESAYGYDRSQADTLAIFITVYNAVHRNDISYFTGIYKKVVYDNLIEEKAGLALSYKQWPGNTMIVIPLTPRAGTGVIADLDTDILTEEGVITELQEEDGQGLEPRREIVELKEDEILEERQEIESERDELARREEELNRQKTEIETDETDERTGELAAVEEELGIIAEAETALDERVREVEEREERVVAERESIAEDQMDEISREDAADQADSSPLAAAEASEAAETAEGAPIPFLKLSGSSGSYTGQLLLINPDSGMIVKRSEVETIRLRGYRRTADEIISVAGEVGGNRIVSIIRIDPESLEIKQSGTAEVYIDSAVVESGGNYYAVVKSDGKWKMGIFNRNLELSRLSEIEVYPATEVYLRGDEIIIQDVSGTIRALSPGDFSTAQ